MAHHFRIKPVPHTNKDGTLSASRKDYVIIDRSRGKVTKVGVTSSRKNADEFITKRRAALVDQHKTNHPNDQKGRKHD